MAANITVPDHLLTVEEWDALEETETSRRYELVEGVLVVSPRPVFRHQDVLSRLIAVLREQLPAGFVALPEVELALDIGSLPTIRVPDITVAGSVDLSRARFLASEPDLVVEIVSPGSRRTDRIMKFAEYQEAGIPSYWILDPDAEGSDRILAHDLVDGRYVESVRAAGAVKVTRPAPMVVDAAEVLTVE